jgi:aromatic-L-amino-acid decarboxylase
VKTFEILPEYLKSKTRGVNNYRDWGIALGRRFRALKLWWVIRNFGVNGLQEKLRTHISLAAKISQFITESDDFELLAPVPLNTVCFRFHPKGIDQEEKLDQINDKLLQTINSTGKCYFSHTKLKGKYTIRFMIGQTQTEESHVTDAWNLIIKTSQELCDLEE